MSFQPIGGQPKVVEVAPERKIDYDRGVIIKYIKELGMEVFMYVDEPGVFLSQHGTEVMPALAARAGFDVALLLRKREHARLVKLATDSYAAKLFIVDEQATRQVIAEQNGFQVVLLGGTRYDILDPTGMSITNGTPLTKEIALETLKDVAASGQEVLDDTRRRLGPGDAPAIPAQAIADNKKTK